VVEWTLVPGVLAGCLALAAPAAHASYDHAGATGTAAARWRALPDAPEGRSEVVAAVQGRTVLVVGGFRADGTSSPRVDVWDDVARRWRRAPDLPIGVNHAMAASDGRSVYVVGGYAPGPGQRGLRHLSRRAFALAAGSRSWRELPPLPRARGAGGAAVVDGRLWVVGGVQRGRPRLARDAYVLDPRSGPWRAAPGPPTPREHLGVAALRGRLYVLGGRVHGYDSNLGAAEVREPSGRWRPMPALPVPCGGCSATAVPGRIVVVGGESPRGVHAAVQAYDVVRRRWTRLPPSPAPRHGLGLGVVGGRVLALLGGPRPGLTVSSTALELVP
jgi:non-specific serine/threonine protein kinase